MEMELAVFVLDKCPVERVRQVSS